MIGMMYKTAVKALIIVQCIREYTAEKSRNTMHWLYCMADILSVCKLNIGFLKG